MSTKGGRRQQLCDKERCYYDYTYDKKSCSSLSLSLYLSISLSLLSFLISIFSWICFQLSWAYMSLHTLFSLSCLARQRRRTPLSLAVSCSSWVKKFGWGYQWVETLAS
jgi:hypothetical protein